MAKKKTYLHIEIPPSLLEAIKIKAEAKRWSIRDLVTVTLLKAFPEPAPSSIVEPKQPNG